jgi:hypothetical protein
MRAAYLLAAVAALWLQPATAGVIIDAVGWGTHTQLLTCIPAYFDEGCTLPETIIDGTAYLTFEVPDFYVSKTGAIEVEDYYSSCPFGGSCHLTAQLDGGFKFEAFSRPYDPFETLIAGGDSFKYRFADVPFFQSFVAIASVPEPSTWAMMLLGFGFVGSAMRSAERRQKVTVSYA